MAQLVKMLRCERCNTEVHGNCVAAIRMCGPCGKSTWHFANEHFHELKGLDSRALSAALDALYRRAGVTA